MPVKSLIQYSPQYIQDLDKEKKDYPIDPMVLAILNGIKKTKQETGPSHSSGHSSGRGYGRDSRDPREPRDSHDSRDVRGPCDPRDLHPGKNANMRRGGYCATGFYEGSYEGSYEETYVSYERNYEGHYGSGPQPHKSGSRMGQREPGVNGYRGAHRGRPPVTGGGRGGGRGRGRGRGRGLGRSGPVLAPRKKLYQEPSAFTDDRMISDIRTILGKLSSENVPTIISQLLKLKLDKEQCLDQTAEVLHEAAIEGVFIIQHFVTIFLEIGKAYPNVIKTQLNQKILGQIREPRTFTNEADTLTQTRQQKAEKWQIHNALLFAELYNRGVYNDDLLRRVLRLYLNRTSPNTPEEQFPLRIITAFLPSIMKKMVQRMTAARDPLDISDVLQKLEAISLDRSYPGEIRYPVKTMVQNWKKSLETTSQ